jgi:hypothetical protein
MPFRWQLRVISTTAVLWRGGSDGHYLWSAGTWKDFTAKWKELGKDPLRLVDVTVHE